MRNYSTLIFIVNSIQSESDSNHLNLVETDINNYLASDPKAEKVPSEQAIENILNFARSYEVLETENAGYVELNLN